MGGDPHPSSPSRTSSEAPDPVYSARKHLRGGGRQWGQQGSCGHVCVFMRFRVCACECVYTPVHVHTVLGIVHVWAHTCSHMCTRVHAHMCVRGYTCICGSLSPASSASLVKWKRPECWGHLLPGTLRPEGGLSRPGPECPCCPCGWCWEGRRETLTARLVPGKHGGSVGTLVSAVERDIGVLLQSLRPPAVGGD